MVKSMNNLIFDLSASKAVTNSFRVTKLLSQQKFNKS